MTLGWTAFPSRIYGWFNQRSTAGTVGEEALAIVFDKSRPLRPSDFDNVSTNHYESLALVNLKFSIYSSK